MKFFLLGLLPPAGKKIPAFSFRPTRSIVLPYLQGGCMDGLRECCGVFARCGRVHKAPFCAPRGWGEERVVAPNLPIRSNPVWSRGAVVLISTTHKCTLCTCCSTGESTECQGEAAPPPLWTPEGVRPTADGSAARSLHHVPTTMKGAPVRCDAITALIRPARGAVFLQCGAHHHARWVRHLPVQHF